MVSFSAALAVVFKSTGGRIWNKRWGLPRLTRTRKENRRRDVRLFNQNLAVLKAAEHLQPAHPVRLTKELPSWQQQLMRERLHAAQRALNLRPVGLPPAAAAAFGARSVAPPKPPARLPTPPVDLQAQQRLHQRQVTAIMARRAAQQQQAAAGGAAASPTAGLQPAAAAPSQQQQQQRQQPQAGAAAAGGGGGGGGQGKAGGGGASGQS